MELVVWDVPHRKIISRKIFRPSRKRRYAVRIPRGGMYGDFLEYRCLAGEAQACKEYHSKRYSHVVPLLPPAHGALCSSSPGRLFVYAFGSLHALRMAAGEMIVTWTREGAFYLDPQTRVDRVPRLACSRAGQVSLFSPDPLLWVYRRGGRASLHYVDLLDANKSGWSPLIRAVGFDWDKPWVLYHSTRKGSLLAWNTRTDLHRRLELCSAQKARQATGRRARPLGPRWWGLAAGTLGHLVLWGDSVLYVLNTKREIVGMLGNRVGLPGLMENQYAN